MSAGDALRPHYIRAHELLPSLLPVAYVVDPDLPLQAGDGEGKLGDDGLIHICARTGFPSDLLPPAQRVDLIEHLANHEIAHGIKKLLERRGIEVENAYWAFRGFRSTWATAQAEADAMPAGQAQWDREPRESFAECIGAALSGRWVQNEHTFNDGKPVDAIAARRWLFSLVGPTPVPQPPVAKATVLWHLSHHSSVRPDGWSGAPDEARWVREDLTPLVVAICRRKGITVTTVDGDLLDHPEFHANYGAFCAPHYEADVHGEGGSFWGRAANSLTPVGDDRLGNIFWRRYRTLVGKPPDRFGWTNVNVTDYYGFRLTSADTPGFLVEHGVGAPSAPDHDWLRQNTPAIAQVWADALVEFLGMEDTVTDQEFVAFYDRLIKPGLDGTIDTMKKTYDPWVHHKHDTTEPKAQQ